jgi:hypothetical protein
MLQNNSNETKMSKSNYVYFMGMPFLYPIKDNKGQIIIKHLCNHDWISQKLNIIEKMESFSHCYLKRSLQDINKDVNVEYSGLYFYPMNNKNSYIDHYMIDESIDFVNMNYHDLNGAKGSTKITGKKNLNDKSISLKDIIDDPYYITLKKREIDVQIKNNSRESIYFNGFLRFNTYEEKLNFLNTGVYWFGLNVHNRSFIRFSDADFVNMIKITDHRWLNKDSKLVLKDVNRILGNKNSGLEFYMPEYLDKGIPRDKIWEKSIWLRFNNFEDCYKAMKIMEPKEETSVSIFIKIDF